MDKIKFIFMQTLMISTAIFFGLGIKAFVNYMRFGEESAYIVWPWYLLLAIILVGFLCALPTNFILALYDDYMGRMVAGVRISLHFLCVLAILSFFGYLFHFYESINDYMVILLMYVIIYVFVWATSLWINKTEDKKMNEAIEEIRDEE